jgi:hypothetical protein
MNKKIELIKKIESIKIEWIKIELIKNIEFSIEENMNNKVYLQISSSSLVLALTVVP